ncbi:MULTISPECIES: hypothetical protein [Sphingomonadales]|nr:MULTISPECIES: hypothetical protein [Sphingomonas]MDX3884693.1 hypothetical protein [Sphingomonas sp.]
MAGNILQRGSQVISDEGMSFGALVYAHHTKVYVEGRRADSHG